jgi:hypothetical protein
MLLIRVPTIAASARIVLEIFPSKFISLHRGWGSARLLGFAVGAVVRRQMQVAKERAESGPRTMLPREAR